ncbi:4a-hydroxytetrahydrobiopterin dehydratase [Prosthecobacter fusiformis]|uniref:Putative pterin-4-alpha-carbinolamine dehydratase n=1 Tax=Prosthecobacter fusiformis TaxID=48464 RepID=A0A4R7RK14_9BACT|nr:4a-hydroxytetrahydrobiopterin dehydratase [Prosthecobacter fusiformis]TDU64527.1 4a-hydroxytetrahydrobiopterin dehydratase [Prosthecobacter fusiformis]
MRLLLSLDNIDSALSSLPGWKREGAELVKTYRFSAYLKGIEFVNLLANSAESLNHHPDLDVGWCKVKVHLSTHSAGGITSLDLDMAQAAESASKAVESTATAPES